MVGVVGIGWIQENKFGSILKSYQSQCLEKKELMTLFCEKSFLPGDINNFGKFKGSSRNICFSVALALHDAGIDCLDKTKTDLGIIGTNQEGCLQSNIDYFKDYVDSGRKIARGNLFIHTLASTPLSETAIAFGCQGPVMYMTFKENHISLTLDQAATMISQGETPRLLVVNGTIQAAICFVLKKVDTEKSLSLKSLKNITDGLLQPSEVIDQLYKKDIL